MLHSTTSSISSRIGTDLGAFRTSWSLLHSSSLCLADEEMKTTTVVEAAQQERQKKWVQYLSTLKPNTRLDEHRAFEEYLLTPDDLKGLPFEKKLRTPFKNSKTHLITYLKTDVEQRAVQVWGSMENVDRQRHYRDDVSNNSLRSALTRIRHYINGTPEELFPPTPDWEGEPMQSSAQHRTDSLNRSMRVVSVAIFSNVVVMFGKFGAAAYTGSGTMLAEGIHSLADVCNQALLAVGIRRSLKAPDREHPYGYLGERYVWALVSGLGIFFVGCGVTTWHGVMGLYNPTPLHDVPVAFAVLGMSAILEGYSLNVALKQVRLNAKHHEMTMMEYIKDGSDPNDVAVLLEDGAAVVGIGIAGTCLGLSHLYDNPMFDAIGSISVGALLGTCACFLVQRNMDALVGKSADTDMLMRVVKAMDNDPAITSTHDVKAIQVGADTVRFKAEIDFNGGIITKKYLTNLDLDSLMKQMNKIQTTAEAESFLLKHGSGVLNILGEEVDRIELKIQTVAPEVRHVDLEIL
eukprot:CFRG3360T1